MKCGRQGACNLLTEWATRCKEGKVHTNQGKVQTKQGKVQTKQGKVQAKQGKVLRLAKEA